MLTDFCKTFNINIVLYNYDEKSGKSIKMNKKNGSIFGDKNASQSFVLATFKNHYFIYDTVPVSRFYLKNREAIKEYANQHQWEQTKQWMTNQKNGNIFKVNSSKCSSMSSLEFIRTLYEMGAFTPLYRNDLDVDIAKVHHYVHLKQDVQSLEFSDNNTKLIKEKERKRPQTNQTIYYADFETCYNQELNKEIEFMLCVQDMAGKD